MNTSPYLRLARGTTQLNTKIHTLSRIISTQPLSQHLFKEPPVRPGMFLIDLDKESEIDDYLEQQDYDIMLSPVKKGQFNWDQYKHTL